MKQELRRVHLWTQFRKQLKKYHDGLFAEGGEYSFSVEAHSNNNSILEERWVKIEKPSFSFDRGLLEKYYQSLEAED